MLKGRTTGYGMTSGVDESFSKDMLTRINVELQEALALLKENSALASSENEASTPNSMGTHGKQPALVQQCLDLLGTHTEALAEPIRSVHHFACTGGTLICKCIAAMPNVHLLSEIDPLSPLAATKEPGVFCPTDMIGLVRQNSRGNDTSLLTSIFRAEVKTLYEHSVRRGVRLVFRDHTHSHYCTGQEPATRPMLRQLLPLDIPQRSVVTVRHPLDSWLSLLVNDWIHFSPVTLEQYSLRYLEFLRSYEDCPIFRFEDFAFNPHAEMKKICDALDLSFSEMFECLFDSIVISGDSGRSGNVIEGRPRRPLPDTVKKEAATSVAYADLCQKLGYQPEA